MLVHVQWNNHRVIALVRKRNGPSFYRFVNTCIQYGLFYNKEILTPEITLLKKNKDALGSIPALLGGSEISWNILFSLWVG